MREQTRLQSAQEHERGAVWCGRRGDALRAAFVLEGEGAGLYVGKHCLLHQKLGLMGGVNAKQPRAVGRAWDVGRADGRGRVSW